MNNRQTWNRILPPLYKKGDRVILVKDSMGHLQEKYNKRKKSIAFYMEVADNGLVGVSFQNGVSDFLPRHYFVPFPFKELKKGQRVRTKVSIHFEASCTYTGSKFARYVLGKNKIGRIIDIETYSTYHRLYKVSFGKDSYAWYEDYELVGCNER